MARTAFLLNRAAFLLSALCVAAALSLLSIPYQKPQITKAVAPTEEAAETPAQRNTLVAGEPREGAPQRIAPLPFRVATTQDVLHEAVLRIDRLKERLKSTTNKNEARKLRAELDAAYRLLDEQLRVVKIGNASAISEEIRESRARAEDANSAVSDLRREVRELEADVKVLKTQVTNLANQPAQAKDGDSFWKGTAPLLISLLGAFCSLVVTGVACLEHIRKRRQSRIKDTVQLRQTA